MLAYAQSVLDLAAEQIAEIERLHDETLATGVPSGRMQALIKNVVENQRSVLDYTAQAVAEKYGCGTDPYWMGVAKPGLFAVAIEKQLPGILKNQPKIAAVFERHQPYQPGHDWLPHLYALTRENKHHRLTPQARGEGIMPPAVLGSGMARTTGPVVAFVRWDFDSPAVPVMETLRRIQAGVEICANDVSSAAAL